VPAVAGARGFPLIVDLAAIDDTRDLNPRAELSRHAALPAARPTMSEYRQQIVRKAGLPQRKRR